MQTDTEEEKSSVQFKQPHQEGYSLMQKYVIKSKRANPILKNTVKPVRSHQTTSSNALFNQDQIQVPEQYEVEKVYDQVQSFKQNEQAIQQVQENVIRQTIATKLPKVDTHAAVPSNQFNIYFAHTQRLAQIITQCQLLSTVPPSESLLAQGIIKPVEKCNSFTALTRIFQHYGQFFSTYGSVRQENLNCSTINALLDQITHPSFQLHDLPAFQARFQNCPFQAADGLQIAPLINPLIPGGLAAMRAAWVFPQQYPGPVFQDKLGFITIKERIIRHLEMLRDAYPHTFYPEIEQMVMTGGYAVHKRQIQNCADTFIPVGLQPPFPLLLYKLYFEQQLNAFKQDYAPALQLLRIVPLTPDQVFGIQRAIDVIIRVNANQFMRFWQKRDTPETFIPSKQGQPSQLIVFNVQGGQSHHLQRKDQVVFQHVTQTTRSVRDYFWFKFDLPDEEIDAMQQIIIPDSTKDLVD